MKWHKVILPKGTKHHLIFSPHCPIPTLIKFLFLSQDILLGLLKKVFSSPAKATKGRSLPLKVVVMSATLETDKLSAFLGNCPVFIIPGRTFPVTCTFGSAVGPKDTESTAYVKEVLHLSSESFFFLIDNIVTENVIYLDLVS